jgi:anti-anti-sigma regulatory factor
MCKSLPDSRKFRIINCSDAVREILEVTGFDQIFQIG